MRCSAITGMQFSAHDMPGHPESNTRLVTACSGLDPRCPVYPPQACSIEDLKRVHSPSYITMLQEQCSRTTTIKFLDPDTYITRHSFDVAVLAAGSAIAAVERSLSGEHCFALVRPPGHHAEYNHAMGFCLVNNAAVAAAGALEKTDRIAIVDWDYHHGNGTQHAFASSNRVLYCSVHQGDAFPFTGHISETGSKDGAGFTINAPLHAGASIADYAYLFSEVFVPALTRFRPDAIIVSAGQDILFDDPLGMMEILPRDFEILTSMLVASTGVPLALVLEGGYGPSHGEAVSHIFAALRSEHNPEHEIREPRESTQDIVTSLKKIHRIG
jgi:acetoin utilization deacetylase AcuC-like enzyme